MSLVILLLPALWTVTIVTTSSGGHVTWNVTKLTSGFPESRISPKDVWDLLSSNLISLSSSRTLEGISRKEATDLQDEEETTILRAFPRNPISSNLNVIMRLQKLDYYFSTLRISEEDCRLRLLCEVARDPAKFSPLAVAFLDETRFIGEESSLAGRLLKSQPGTKLLSYIDATLRGRRRNGCEVYVYRCPKSTESMINYETLLLWREMSKWLTVKMISKAKTSQDL